MNEKVNKAVMDVETQQALEDLVDYAEAQQTPTRRLVALATDIEMAAAHLRKYTKARVQLASPAEDADGPTGDGPTRVLEYRVGNLVVKSSQLPTSINELVVDALLAHVEGRIFTIWGAISEVSGAANELIGKKRAGEKQ
jgi:hypothetical protein